MMMNAYRHPILLHPEPLSQLQPELFAAFLAPFHIEEVSQAFDHVSQAFHHGPLLIARIALAASFEEEEEVDPEWIWLEL